MIYWFGLCIGFFRCSYNYEIGCLIFCHVAKHVYAVSCDISCWIKMKCLGWQRGGTPVLKWTYTACHKLSVRNYSGHMKNRKFPTIIPIVRDKCPNLLLTKYNSLTGMQVFKPWSVGKWQLRWELHMSKWWPINRRGWSQISLKNEVLSSRMGRSMHQSIFGQGMRSYFPTRCEGKGLGLPPWLCWA
jgi:hypothetical protein